MTSDLERLITELEVVTAEMVDMTCWESMEFDGLSASRHTLCALLMERQDLDADAAELIDGVIQAGSGLVGQVIAMRELVLEEIARTETEWRFAHELGRSVHGHAQPHHVDTKA